jgi:hypothetical protein
MCILEVLHKFVKGWNTCDLVSASKQLYRFSTLEREREREKKNKTMETFTNNYCASSDFQKY